MSAAVPYFDLTGQYEELREEVLAALDRVCRSAQFVLGDEVEQFEREFADYCGAAHCVALNSGTSALHLALLAAGVGPGDEVITSPNTFVATAEAISYTGATPVFADVLPETGNVDPAAVERAVTGRTRAIVPVHLYGRPAELGPLARAGRDARRPARRGRVPGARRALPRPSRRRVRARGRLQLLPRQEPRRVRRGRRAHDRRRGRRRARPLPP